MDSYVSVRDKICSDWLLALCCLFAVTPADFLQFCMCSIFMRVLIANEVRF